MIAVVNNQNCAGHCLTVFSSSSGSHPHLPVGHRSRPEEESAGT